MAGDHPVERPKPMRALTTSILPNQGTRGPPPPPPSPPPLASSVGPGIPTPDARPPAKRARKAINCEPCRASKLKCNRSRPCSSCVLRGTTSLCYQDSQPPDLTDGLPRGPPRTLPGRIDPTQEIAKVRHSLTLLESYVLGGSSLASSLEVAAGQLDQLAHSITGTAPLPAPARVDEKAARAETPQPAEFSEKPGATGSLGRQTGGLYAGPTAAVTLFSSNDPREGEHSSDRHTSEEPLQEYDRDLLALLPPLPTIEALVAYYFDYCKWIYRYVNHTSFNAAWSKYKGAQSTDRLALATACVIIAVATYYLPVQHPLHHSIPPPEHPDEDPGLRFYKIAMRVLDRHITDVRKYSLELVELHLIRCQYLMLSKKDGEAVWAIKGDLLTIATAMGLHRDPGKWRMSREVAERRRWAWWNIVYLERAQAWLFGRPLSISSRHFDTQFPSYCDPKIDPTGKFYAAQIAMFRLGYILGDIMDDAVSLRPVPYSNVLAHDKALGQWMDALPAELLLDNFKFTQNIASSELHVRRQAVQSIVIRAAYYHIRFSLHRPYASKPPSSRRTPEEERDISHSLELAINTADSLLTLVCQSHPSFLTNSALAVPGHMSWFGFHIFSAAIFFAFHLIGHPDTPRAPRLREGIARGMTTLRTTHGAVPDADKTYNILQALAPLHSADARAASPAQRETQKQSVLARVRNLAFPYHDAPASRRARASESPARPPSGSIPPMSPLVDAFGTGLVPPSSTMSTMSTASDGHYGTPGAHVSLGPSLSHRPFGAGGTPTGHDGPLGGYFGMQPMVSPPVGFGAGGQQGYFGAAGNPLTPGGSGLTQQLNPDAQILWGAAIGFGPGEWLQFEDYAQRPGTGVSRGQPMQ